MSYELIRIENLKKNYKDFKAVDDISFSILKGETFGLVGESGCGKSTTGKMIMQLIKPTSGKVIMNGDDLTAKSSSELRNIRHNFQMIFQNPYGSFDPKMSINEILMEPLNVYKSNLMEKDNRIKELLDYVGISSKFLSRYPGELSGGQNQRIAIARALSLEPEFIVADEPVSALDVSIQAQILNLLIDLQKELNLTYLFISHDLSVVEYISNRVAVMYLGKIIEIASCDELYNLPLHPYTEILISTIPIADPSKKLANIEYKNYNYDNLFRNIGCKFYNHCKRKIDICLTKEPKLIEYSPGHYVACHLKEKTI